MKHPAYKLTRKLLDSTYGFYREPQGSIQDIYTVYINRPNKKRYTKSIPSMLIEMELYKSLDLLKESIEITDYTDSRIIVDLVYHSSHTIFLNLINEDENQDIMNINNVVIAFSISTGKNLSSSIVDSKKRLTTQTVELCKSIGLKDYSDDLKVIPVFNNEEYMRTLPTRVFKHIIELGYEIAIIQ